MRKVRLPAIKIIVDPGSATSAPPASIPVFGQKVAPPLHPGHPLNAKRAGAVCGVSRRKTTWNSSQWIAIALLNITSPLAGCFANALFEMFAYVVFAVCKSGSPCSSMFMSKGPKSAPYGSTFCMSIYLTIPKGPFLGKRTYKKISANIMEKYTGEK